MYDTPEQTVDTGCYPSHTHRTITFADIRPPAQMASVDVATFYGINDERRWFFNK